MVPTAAAARVLGIPVVSHESDIVMGKANRWLLDRGGLVLTAFPAKEYNDVKNKFTRYVGMPIHPGYFESSGRKAKNKIVIFGGSQGSVRINRCAEEIWTKLTELSEVVHVSGTYDYKRLRVLHSKLPEETRKKIQILNETDNLPELTSSAKLIIGRAGATSLWEMVYCETPSIVIPLPESAGDHQRLNAIYMSREFPWIKVLDEKELTPDKLLQMVKTGISGSLGDAQSTSLIMPKDAVAEIGTVLSEMLDKAYLSRPRNIHIVGLKGVSMAGIAKILGQQGHRVTGSDLVIAGHSAANITKKIDVVVYSSAASDKSAPGYVEIEKAKELGIPTYKRSVFISKLFNANKVVAISGMHGKSTVTSMTTFILSQAGYSPKYLIGVPEDRSFAGIGAAGWGRGFVAVVEACEYDRSFCDLKSDVMVVTNIEEEHLDYFKGGLREIEKAFADFVLDSRFDSTLVISPQPTVQKVAQGAQEIRTDIMLVKTGIVNNIDWQQYQFFGKHNYLDASLAVAACETFGIDKQTSWEILKKFKGAKRRMEYVGEYNGNPVYDDYGHHPTEIKTVLDAVKQKYPEEKILLIFQPHQISRTRSFFNDFVKNLSFADKAIITDIYEVAGREKQEDISASSIAEKINQQTPGKAEFIPLPYENIERHIGNMTDFKGIIITMGATDIYMVSYALTGRSINHNR